MSLPTAAIKDRILQTIGGIYSYNFFSGFCSLFDKQILLCVCHFCILKKKVIEKALVLPGPKSKLEN